MIAVPKPVRSPAHLAFIRSLPCCVSGRTWGVEAAHVGSRGMGQKCSDLETIPLNSLYHKEQHRIGLKVFARTYGLDIPALIEMLNPRPKLSIGWIEDAFDQPVPFFRAEYGGNLLWLGRTRDGMPHSIRLLEGRVREILTEEILKRVNEWKAK